MKRLKTLINRNLKESMKKGGCGECQTSCQSACKTSCTVGNQSCEKDEEGGDWPLSKKQEKPFYYGFSSFVKLIFKLTIVNWLERRLVLITDTTSKGKFNLLKINLTSSS